MLACQFNTTNDSANDIALMQGVYTFSFTVWYNERVLYWKNSTQTTIGHMEEVTLVLTCDEMKFSFSAFFFRYASSPTSLICRKKYTQKKKPYNWKGANIVAKIQWRLRSVTISIKNTPFKVCSQKRETCLAVYLSELKWTKVVALTMETKGCGVLKS